MSHLLGELRRFPGDRLPAGWISCDGAAIPISEHQPLFSLLGWRFGGDGRTTFRLPVLATHPCATLSYGIALNGLYPTRFGPMPGDAHIGEIRLFGGEYPPAGWLPCDGRTLPIAEPYLELYDIVGTIWGGDVEHFVLPDLRDTEHQDGNDIVGRLTYIIATAGRRPEAE